MEKEIPTIILTDDEIAKIDTVAVKNRFDGQSTKKLLYPVSDIERIKNFLHCYRFLESIKNGLVERSKDISEKIGTYLDKVYPFYFEAIRLGRKAELLGNGFGSYSNLKDIGSFLDANLEVVSSVESLVSQLGKVSRVNDPDEYQGHF